MLFSFFWTRKTFRQGQSGFLHDFTQFCFLLTAHTLVIRLSSSVVPVPRSLFLYLLFLPSLHRHIHFMANTFPLWFWVFTFEDVLMNSPTRLFVSSDALISAWAFYAGPSSTANSTGGVPSSLSQLASLTTALMSIPTSSVAGKKPSDFTPTPPCLPWNARVVPCSWLSHTFSSLDSYCQPFLLPWFPNEFGLTVRFRASDPNQITSFNGDEHFNAGGMGNPFYYCCDIFQLPPFILQTCSDDFHP